MPGLIPLKGATLADWQSQLRGVPDRAAPAFIPGGSRYAR